MSGPSVLLGGEFALDPSMFLGPASPKGLALPSSAAGTGRAALTLIARALRAQGCRSIHLPSFICDSVVAPFVRLGFRIAFFPVDLDLQIDLTSFENRKHAAAPAALLFVNYFGFPPGTAVKERLRKIAADHVVIEDCTHGSLLESRRPPVGAIGQIVFSSLRKYLPLPDGCVVLNKGTLRIPDPDPVGSECASLRSVAAFLKAVYLESFRKDDALERTYLKLFAHAEHLIEKQKDGASCSALSRHLAARLNLQRVQMRRRANFRFLRQAFLQDRRLQRLAEPMIGHLPAGVSPLAFPILARTGRRDRLRATLREQRLFCAVHWPLPAQVDAKRFPEAEELSSRILSLPVDQRYGPSEMKEIVRRLAAVASKA